MIKSAETIRPLVLLLLLTLTVFANCLFNSFAYDDKVFVVNNPEIRQLTNAPGFFVSAKAYAGERNFFVYRPLAACSYALDYFCWGLKPFGYHLANVFWHLLNVLLVYFLAVQLSGNRSTASIAAGIFAIHPAQVETVAWISSRSNLLSLFFLLAACLCYLRYSRLNYKLSLLFFILALLAKETALVFLLLIWLYDYYFALKEGKEKAANAWWSYLPFWVSAVLYLVLRTTVLGHFGQRSWWGGSFFVTALTMSKSFLHYLAITIFPAGLSVDHVFLLSHNLLEPEVLAGAVALLLIIITAVAVSQRRKVVAFGLFWFLICLLPVSNIIPLEAHLAERFLYFPLIGFGLVLADPLGGILANPDTVRSRRWLVLTLLAVLLLAYGWRTVERNRDWRSDFSLWRSAVLTSPESPRAHYALGDIYYQQGKFGEAADQYQLALQLNPRVAELYNALGLAWEGLGDYRQSITVYQEGMKVPSLDNGAKVNLMINLGNANSRLHNYKEAIAYYRKVLDLEPGNPEAGHNLAVIGRLTKNVVH